MVIGNVFISDACCMSGSSLSEKLIQGDCNFRWPLHSTYYYVVTELSYYRIQSWNKKWKGNLKFVAKISNIQCIIISSHDFAFYLFLLLKVLHIVIYLPFSWFCFQKSNVWSPFSWFCSLKHFLSKPALSMRLYSEIIIDRKGHLLY